MATTILSILSKANTKIAKISIAKMVEIFIHIMKCFEYLIGTFFKLVATL
jgi:hypothetical protein